MRITKVPRIKSFKQMENPTKFAIHTPHAAKILQHISLNHIEIVLVYFIVVILSGRLIVE